MQRIAIIFILLIPLVATLNAQVTPDTLYVGAGWNIIGSLASGAASEILRCEPDTIITSAFFAYNPGGGYEAKDTLKKGVGYWVKVSEDGVIIFGSNAEWMCGNTIEYSEKVYNTVQIGSQCWLKENLDVGTMIDSLQEQTDNDEIEKYCYNDIIENCNTYGGLYQWNEAMQYTTTPGTRGICPLGWHIPTLDEFETLSNTVGGDGNALKAIGQGTGDGAGTNTSGFSALLAGARGSNGYFYDLLYYAYFWSSTEGDASSAYVMYLYYSDSHVFLFYYTGKGSGYSVRCLKD